ncbi:MAG: 30S ribosomal protein S6 [Nitrospirae bacterium]|nr:30S ribosomal protein S6 [Nitrospirota bacterium]
MNYYENLLIIDPTLDDKETEKTIDRVKDVITKSGGEILKSDKWGRRRLAYTIKKHAEGFYMLLLFKASSASIAELERLFKVLDPVLKFIVVKLKKKEVAHIEAALSQAETKKKEEASKAEATAATVPAPAAGS